MMPANSKQSMPRRLQRSGQYRCQQRQQGFTLLEILAAFLVFTLSFAVVMQVVSSSLRNTRLSGNLTQAALFAQSKMDLLGIDAPVEEGSDSGEFDEKYSWELEVTPYLPEDDRTLNTDLIPVDMFQVDLTVFWQQARQQQQTTFTTLYSQDSNFQSRAFDG